MDLPRFLVVGGAGFIGSHLVEQLTALGSVTVYDNLSVGRREFLRAAFESGRVELVEGDALDLEHLTRVAAGHDAAFHLSANPEARHGLANTRLDLEQGTIATYNVLEALRRTGVGRIVLASSGTVYGDTPESCSEGDLGALPISLYGASKLAAEALTSAYVECFGLSAVIARFGNVVGPRGTHGAALDFLRKLARSPEELEVLGDGRQAKPYVHVSDCVAALVHLFSRAEGSLDVVNIAPRDLTSVRRIAELCVAVSPYPDARIRYTGGDRGWRGDVPVSRLDPSKLEAHGFRLTRSSDEAVEAAVRALAVEVFGACRP
jgi:UDP-glucose 4-epimerase